MNDEYRNLLIAAEQKSQDDYDKTIVSLSGGALGISLIFIKDIVGTADPVLVWTVITAWALWASSLTSVVISYFLSHLALRKAIAQTDKKDFSGGVGGCAAIAVQVFNALSGILFIAGVLFIIIFSANNIGSSPMGDKENNDYVEKGYVPPTPKPLTEGVVPPPPPPAPLPEEKK